MKRRKEEQEEGTDGERKGDGAAARRTPRDRSRRRSALACPHRRPFFFIYFGFGLRSGARRGRDGRQVGADIWRRHA